MDTVENQLDELRAAHKFFRARARALSSRVIAKQIDCSHAAVAYALQGKHVSGTVGEKMAEFWSTYCAELLQRPKI
jgi:hypothetical protein